MRTIEEIADDLRNSETGPGVFDVAVEDVPHDWQEQVGMLPDVCARCGGTRSTSAYVCRQSIEAPMVDENGLRGTFGLSMTSEPAGLVRVEGADDAGVSRWSYKCHASARAVLNVLRSHGWALVPLDDEVNDTVEQYERLRVSLAETGGGWLVSDWEIVNGSTARVLADGQTVGAYALDNEAEAWEDARGRITQDETPTGNLAPVEARVECVPATGRACFACGELVGTDEFQRAGAWFCDSDCIDNFTEHAVREAVEREEGRA